MKWVSERQSKERLLASVSEMLTEVARCVPYTVSPEWFTVDLTMPQARGVFLLMQNGIQRMNSLSFTLDISFSRATALMDQLVEKGMVERWTDPEDRRSVLCALTEDGKELAQRLLMERRSRWEERLAPLSMGELQRVSDAMELVRDAIQRAAIVAGPAVTTSN